MIGGNTEVEESWHTSDRVTEQWGIMNEMCKHEHIPKQDTKFGLKQETNWYKKWIERKKERKTETNKRKNNSD